MTTAELTTLMTNTSKRWNDILFAQRNQYEDGIPNLADLKAAYGRRNGEAWIPNFTYKAGELVSVGNNLYVSKTEGNQGNEPAISPDNWNNISTNSLIAGNFFVGAFCNFTVTSNQIIIENNYNIDSIINISSAAFNTLDYSSMKLLVRMRESSNISGGDYLVFTNFAQLKSNIVSSPRLSANEKKARDIVCFNKKPLEFNLGGEYMRNVKYSVVVVPATQTSTN